MLEIHVPSSELYDPTTNRFIEVDAVVLRLEHSLVSLSKWESVFKKPFLSKEDKTREEIFGYVRMMNSTPEVPSEVFDRLTQANMDAISEYMNDRFSATWFSEMPGQQPQRRDVITSEIIYYWMNSLNVPMECEHWHLNRLITLIKVHNAKNQPKKKGQRPTGSAMQARRELAAARREQYGTRG